MSPVAKLMAAFIIIPFIELFLLLRVGEWIGGWRTFALVIATGIAGAALARREGFAAMMRLRQCIALGEPPTEALLDAILIFMAGVVLITPGFLTDLTGIALLLPAPRRAVNGWIRRYLSRLTITTHRWPRDPKP